MYVCVCFCVVFFYIGNIYIYYTSSNPWIPSYFILNSLQELLKNVDKTAIELFAELIFKGVDVQFVNEFLVLLNSMCVCQGEPMADMQALLRERLFQREGDEVVLDIEVDQNTNMVMVDAPYDPDGAFSRQGLAYLKWPRKSIPLHTFLLDPAQNKYFATSVQFMATVSLFQLSPFFSLIEHNSV